MTSIIDEIEKKYLSECIGKLAPNHLLLGPQEVIDLYQALKCIARYETVFPDRTKSEMVYRGMFVIAKRSPGIEVGFSDDPITTAGRFLYGKKNYTVSEPADLREAIDKLKKLKGEAMTKKEPRSTGYSCPSCDELFTDETEFWKHLSWHHTTASSGLPKTPPPESAMMSDKIEQLETECKTLRERLEALEKNADKDPYK